MKKLILGIVAACACVGLHSCYNDDDIWESVEALDARVATLEQQVKTANSEISAINTIVTALQSKLTITKVTNTTDGYVITFSDNTTATIRNGVNGTPGKDAPVIGVRKDVDDVYYWTLTVDGNTDWLLDGAGKKLPVTGPQGPAGPTGPDGTPGTPGTPGVTPVMGVDAEGYWTVNTGSGAQRVLDAAGQPVKAVGTNGDSFFKNVAVTDENVTFTLADETSFIIPRLDNFGFTIDGWTGFFPSGQTVELDVTLTNARKVSVMGISGDDWTVKYANSKLSVTAPAPANLTEANRKAELDLAAISSAGYVKVVTLAMDAMSVLSFEDADAKFTPYTLAYCSKTISKWSDLIAATQYGDPMLYGSGSGMAEPYWWYDENNTNLKMVMNGNPDWGDMAYCFWNGGQVISNYYDANFTGKTFNEQLEIAVTGATAGHAGHNGSANFCVQNGYADNYNTSIGHGKLSGFSFGDDVERVVDHMYITITSYGLNSITAGDGFNTPATPETWVKVIAYGWDKDGASTGQAEAYIVKDGKAVNEWTKFDLSSLGKVAKVEFNIDASADQKGPYGLNFPAYFAYDDVAVRF